MYLVDYNKLFEDFFETPKTRAATATHKQVVVDVSNDVLRIGLAVPGQTKETLEITIDENFIKVNSIQTDTDDKIWNAIALPVNESLNIGTNWDLSATLATVKDGILYISLPKIEEKKPKKQSVKIG